MNNIHRIHPEIPSATIGDIIQVDLGHDIETGLVTARIGAGAGKRYRVLFAGGNTLLIRGYDIVNRNYLP